MSTSLYQANTQWATRPADQRYPSLDALHEAVTHSREVSREQTGVQLAALRIEPHAFVDATTKDIVTEPSVVGQAGNPARFTHHSFGQFCRRLGAPAGYVRELPTELACQVLSYGLQKTATTDHQADTYLFSQNGGLKLRAVTSDKYTRIWNSDITSRLLRLRERLPEWQEAPAAYDGSRGMYASDHDMFAFMVDNNRRIFETMPGGGLSRGFFVWNSEEGAASFGIMTFLYQFICGNHIVWNAEGVQELRIRHVGNADDRAFREIGVELRKYADASASDDEARIQSTMTFKLGGSKEAVLDRVFGLRVPALSRKLIGEAYDRAATHEDWYGDPRTAWGMASGLTEIARDNPHVDERVAIDRAASKVLQVAF